MSGETNGRNLTGWVESAAKHLTVAGGLCLILSLTYDWGYFYALGFSLGQLPATLADHTRSALVWIPRVVVGWGIVFALELLTRRIEQGMTEEEIIAASANPEKIGRFRASPYPFLYLATAVGIVLYLALGEGSIPGAYFGLPILWMGFGFWLSNHPRIAARRSRAVALAIVFIPAILLYMWVYGYSHGRGVIGEQQPLERVYLRGEPHTVLDANVLRSWERGVLIRLPGKPQTAFILWTDIAKIEKTRPREEFQGFICAWFGKCVKRTEEKK
jgi:hypothetical protein